MFRLTRHALANVLVMAQTNAKGVTASTLSAVTAASQIGGDVTAFAVDKAAAEAVAKVAGVSAVVHPENDILKNELAENCSKYISDLVKSKSYTHVLAPSSAYGKSVLPRIGATLDSQPLTDISAVHGEDTFTRAMYAGNVITKVKMSDAVKLLSVRSASFDKAAATGGSASIEAAGAAEETGLSEFVKKETSQSDKPDLQSAERVVSGGRGMKDPSNWHMVEELADKLGAAVGATRAVVDAEWVASDLQVGQTGKIVAPNLYIACGISGAIQHVTGMKDSKTIVAINTDEDAPIMSLCDYGLVADALKAVPEMTGKL
ncbi:putative electron transfer flavoprotein subunit alpha [Diplonema papillatum]|nr:putative electron transfer flavoprotein subunit alpha [Diplonema papillatum]